MTGADVPTEMLSMETALSSTNSSMDVDKPRAPRFEAYVMTGDAILNLSRTTHSPEYLPLHSKRRSVQQPSNSVPTSPSDLAAMPKPWELDTQSAAKTPTSSSLGRNSKSEEALAVHLEKETPPAEERTLSHVSTLEEGVTEAERIVWTYNAPLSSMTEKELRRYEAEQFWLSTRTEGKSYKETKQITRLEETTATTTMTTTTTTTQVEDDFSSSTSQNVAEESGCDTQTATQANPNADREKMTHSDRPEPESANGNVESSINDYYSQDDNTPASPVRSTLTRSSTEEESDADSLQSVHYSPKGVDMPSAIRLAKRYKLSHFFLLHSFFGLFCLFLFENGIPR